MRRPRWQRCFGVALVAALGFALASAADEIDAPPVGGPSVVSRIAEIHRRVQAVLVYPDLARRNGIVGVSRIRFEIGHEGRALRIEVVHSSGSGLLDRAAERAVGDASELPWVFGRLEIPVRFALDPQRRRGDLADSR